eukprot:scaffold7656_cov121-Isochrysis_galbana.AAC.4
MPHALARRQGMQPREPQASFPRRRKLPPVPPPARPPSWPPSPGSRSGSPQIAACRTGRRHRSAVSSARRPQARAGP